MMMFKRKLKRRYKDAGEIYKEFMRHTDWCVESITEFLNSIPDADVEEVVHGKWLKNNTMCSVCKEINPTMYLNEWDLEYKALVLPYCPKCGAKMDGGIK